MRKQDRVKRMCLLALGIYLGSNVIMGACGNRPSMKNEHEKRPQKNIAITRNSVMPFELYNLNHDIEKAFQIVQKKRSTQQEIDDQANLTTQDNSANDMVYLGNFKITFYADNDKDQENYVGQTSTGVKPSVGTTIAVDPKVIPYGSIVYIEGFGERIAQDCGGAIKNNKIDVFVSDYQEACDLGVQYKKVWMIKKG